MKTKIHVNQHIIKHNRTHGTDQPVITCKTYQSNRYCHRAKIILDDGTVVAEVIYSPDKPLACGAHVWIETDMDVITE